MTQLPQPLQSPTHTPPTQHQTHKPHPHLLAQETWLQILHHLDFRSLARLSQTSHSFATLCLDPSLWKHLCLLNRVTLITDDDHTDTTNDTQDQSVEDVFSLSGLLLDNSEIETLSGAGTTEVSSGIKKTDWKRQFIMHRKRVLERMRKSRAYWAEYQNLQRLAKVTVVDDAAERVRRMLRLQNPVPVIPCLQCEADRANAFSTSSTSLSSVSSSRTCIGNVGFERGGVIGGQKRWVSDVTVVDSDEEDSDISNEMSSSPELESISLPSSLRSLCFVKPNVHSAAVNRNAFFGVSPTTNSTSHASVSRSSSGSNFTTTNSLAGSPRSSFINHTLTSGCELGRGLKDYVPREAAIKAFLSMESSSGNGSSSGVSGNGVSINNSGSSVGIHDGVLVGSPPSLSATNINEGGVHFLRRSSFGSRTSGPGGGIVAELTNISRRMLLHDEGY